MRSLAGRSAISRLRGACTAALLAAAMGVPTSAQASVVPVPEHPDMRIQVASHPGTITTDSQVVYRVTVTDEGAVQAGLLLDNDITVVSTLDNGVFVGPGGGCHEKATCTIQVPGPIMPGSSATFDLPAKLVKAESTNVTITSKIDDVDLANTDPSDDTASATTTVVGAGCTYQGEPVNGASACRVGYFPPGEHKFGNHSLVVPTVEGDTTPGVIGELAEVGSDSTFCKYHDCRYGIGVLENFFQVEGYEVKDKHNPLRTVINTPKGDPCRGVGDGRACSVLQYEVQPADEWATNPKPDPVIPACVVSGQIGANQKLCLDKRLKTTAGAMRFEVLLPSDDPGMY